ncbi:GIY-YIG nuclease family protein [Clostridium sp. CS001]|uniref:GIY-YIG nuclease family protein n=1 Tax=Clostridium sp. CS001 TaxID=2880648 RepID=UPI001CF304B8|nr:GIY-YIG nuclease family protein [Clostridium sp. CS001]MCB2289434.1 GIY-YIG nuclease family protein [Clostridium sp. CS001]
MYGIYNIYNNNNLLYVGKTNNFHTRLRNHMALQPWKNEITHIAIAECKNKIDMDIYEIYYINKLNPKYNKAIVYNESPTFEIKELSFKKFELTKFLDIGKPKESEVKRSIGVNEKRKYEIEELLKESIEINQGDKVDFLNSSKALYHWSNSSKTELNFFQIKGNNIFFRGLLEDIKKGQCELIDNEYNFIFNDREDMFTNSERYNFSLEINTYIISPKRISKGFCYANLISGISLDKKTKDIILYVNKHILDKYFCDYFIY